MLSEGIKVAKIMPGFNDKMRRHNLAMTVPSIDLLFTIDIFLYTIRMSYGHLQLQRRIHKKYTNDISYIRMCEAPMSAPIRKEGVRRRCNPCKLQSQSRCFEQ